MLLVLRGDVAGCYKKDVVSATWGSVATRKMLLVQRGDVAGCYDEDVPQKRNVVLLVGDVVDVVSLMMEVVGAVYFRITEMFSKKDMLNEPNYL
ncbi:hypothetical protein BgiBS90_005799, partial [Biomphalaria glabrata]